MATKLRSVAALFLGFVCCALVVWLWPMLHDRLMRRDRSLDAAYYSITLSMPLSEVTKLMKSAGKRSHEFHLGQPGGFEFEYAAAARSGAAYFVSWDNGFDWVYTVAFDFEDRAIYKAQGGT